MCIGKWRWASLISMETVHSWLLIVARVDAWVSILKCGTIRCWFRVERSITGCRSPVFFGTRKNVGCRTQGMTLCEPSLWLPWTSGHRWPAGDPDVCFWSEMRCAGRWAEVNAGTASPPPPRQCWRPDRSPISSATCQQSPPGEPHLHPISVGLQRQQKQLLRRRQHERTDCLGQLFSEIWVSVMILVYQRLTFCLVVGTFSWQCLSSWSWKTM